jgi:hypothetical protein
VRGIRSFFELSPALKAGAPCGLMINGICGLRLVKPGRLIEVSFLTD